MDFNKVSPFALRSLNDAYYYLVVTHGFLSDSDLKKQISDLCKSLNSVIDTVFKVYEKEDHKTAQ